MTKAGKRCKRMTNNKNGKCWQINFRCLNWRMSRKFLDIIHRNIQPWQIRKVSVPETVKVQVFAQVKFPEQCLELSGDVWLVIRCISVRRKNIILRINQQGSAVIRKKRRQFIHKSIRYRDDPVLLCLCSKLTFVYNFDDFLLRIYPWVFQMQYLIQSQSRVCCDGYNQLHFLMPYVCKYQIYFLWRERQQFLILYSYLWNLAELVMRK